MHFLVFDVLNINLLILDLYKLLKSSNLSNDELLAFFCNSKHIHFENISAVRVLMLEVLSWGLFGVTLCVVHYVLSSLVANYV